MKSQNRWRGAGLLYGGGWALLAAAVPPAHGTLKLQVGEALPAFTLPVADHAAGTYGLEQLKGQPSVLLFWRPNQKLSLEALRDVEALAQELGAQRLRAVAVDAARSTAEEVTAALASEHLSFPLLLDPQRELYSTVGVIVCPTTLVLDAHGVLQFVIASHPPQYRSVLGARLRFLLGDIDEQAMNQEVEPTVLRLDEDLAAAWRMYQLGQRLQAEAKSEEAAAVYEKAVAQYPSLVEARCALGFMKLSAGELSAAAEHFQVALTYDPESATARLGQAAVLARTGQPRRAEHTLLALLGDKANAARVRYELGRLYQARGEVEKAATFYQDALANVFPEAGASGRTSPLMAAAEEPTAATEPPAAVTPNAGTAAPAGAAPAPTAANHTGAAPVAAAADAEYVGVKTCKKCHLQQWKSWQDTKMANAVTVLKPGASPEVKQRHQLDPQKDYSTDPQCLTCHATAGHGVDSGVACESCHGPGGKFISIHKDIQEKKRPYQQDELYAVGQFKVDVHVCAACHDEHAPCIGPGYTFDFEQRKEQGTHQHFELQFRNK